MNADESRARVIGYVIADGNVEVRPAPAGDLYYLSMGSQNLADYIDRRITVAGLTGITRINNGGGGATFHIPVSVLGRYFLPEHGVPYPFDPPASYLNEPVYPANLGSGCALQHYLSGIIELDGAQGSTFPKDQQVLDDPHPTKRNAMASLWQVMGATTVSISGQSVVLQPVDYPLVQCLPLRNYGRAVGGAPAPGLCAP